jgi:hypothetical protein
MPMAGCAVSQDSSFFAPAYSESSSYESRPLNCLDQRCRIASTDDATYPAPVRLPMSIEIAGLMALGVLTVAMGLLIVFVCFRLSELNKMIAEVEARISRLEILTSLADSKEPAEEQTKQNAGGT